jgi:quinol monooxygenase YgiN
MITVTVHIPDKPQHAADFISHMHALAPVVRAEQGCLTYNLYTDPYRPDMLFMYEEWQDMDALRAHLEQPHMNEHRRTTKDWLAGDVTLHTTRSTPVTL